MTPHPSMLTAEASTSNRARFIENLQSLSKFALRSFAFRNLRYRIFRFRNSSMAEWTHDDTQVSDEEPPEHRATPCAEPRTPQTERGGGVPRRRCGLRRGGWRRVGAARDHGRARA